MIAIELASPCSCSAEMPEEIRGREVADLSRRELEVLYAWISRGSKQEVARELFISYSTVATHIERARDKYAELDRQASDKTSLLLRLLEDGYVRFDHDN